MIQFHHKMSGVSFRIHALQIHVCTFPQVDHGEKEFEHEDEILVEPPSNETRPYAIDSNKARCYLHSTVSFFPQVVIAVSGLPLDLQTTSST